MNPTEADLVVDVMHAFSDMAFKMNIENTDKEVMLAAHNLGTTLRTLLTVAEGAHAHE